MKALHEILADYGQYNYNSNLSYVAQYDSRKCLLIVILISFCLCLFFFFF